jgi:hypothetical protein
MFRHDDLALSRQKFKHVYHHPRPVE